MKQRFFLFLLSLSISCQTTPNATSKIKDDVIFLTDDLLEGRQTGAEGKGRLPSILPCVLSI